VSGTVVVGVDGSAGSIAALEFALRDAARRRARLRVVAAVHPPEFWATAYGPVPVPPPKALLDELAAAARGWVRETAQRLDLAVPVDVVTCPGPPVPALLEQSADADLLVIGHRGRGALMSALLGSVRLGCTRHARCPVTVVRPVPAREDTEELDPVTAMAAPQSRT
jgi:nucleotide-binding universal stress UspA family protein